MSRTRTMHTAARRRRTRSGASPTTRTTCGDDRPCQHVRSAQAVGRAGSALLGRLV
jgi:hypothetical protein